MLKTFNKIRKGFTLAETVISIGLFGIILTIVISLFMMSVDHVAEENKAFKYHRGIDNFVYTMTKEVKSAVKVVVSGTERNPVLEIIGDDFLVVYNVNNLRGDIIRNEDETDLTIASDFVSCTFHQEDETSFTMTLSLTEKDIITQTFRCGSPQQIDTPSDEPPVDNTTEETPIEDSEEESQTENNL